MKTLILIDGSGLVYRGFYAIPPFFTSPGGVKTNAVFGFTNILLSLISEQRPDYMAIAFDKKGPTFRHEAYHAYKATRTKAPQELYDQIPVVWELVSSMGIRLFAKDGFEADDLIATIVQKMLPEKDVRVLIATGDFDLFQLADEKVKILYPVKGFRGAETFGAPEIEAKYGLKPSQIPHYKGLAGDSSDNLPGVFGIGEKTAKKLLQEYGTLEAIYKNLGAFAEKNRLRLEQGRENAFLSKRLAMLDANVSIDFELSSCAADKIDIRKTKEVFTNLGFTSLLKRLEELYPSAGEQKSLF